MYGEQRCRGEVRQPLYTSLYHFVSRLGEYLPLRCDSGYLQAEECGERLPDLLAELLRLAERLVSSSEAVYG